MTREDRNDALHALAEISTYLERLEDALESLPGEHGDFLATLGSIQSGLDEQVEHLKHLITRQVVDRPDQRGDAT